MNDYLTMAIWAAVIGAVFAFTWRKGYLKKVADYVQETQRELKQCTWPTREELKGSTVVVIVAFALLAALTMGVDVMVAFVVRQLL